MERKGKFCCKIREEEKEVSGNAEARFSGDPTERTTTLLLLHKTQQNLPN